MCPSYSFILKRSHLLVYLHSLNVARPLCMLLIQRFLSKDSLRMNCICEKRDQYNRTLLNIFCIATNFVCILYWDVCLVGVGTQQHCHICNRRLSQVDIRLACGVPQSSPWFSIRTYLDSQLHDFYILTLHAKEGLCMQGQICRSH